MFVSISKQLVSCQNCFSVLSRLRQGKKSKKKRSFLMSNTSAGNIALCRGQHNCNMLPASDWLSGSPERVRHASSEFGAKLIMDRTKCEIKIDQKKK